MGPKTEQIGRYKLVERLGAGGMAEVFKARISSTHGFEKTLVLKCLLPDLANKPEYVDMFVTEARIMAALNHPNVVQVLDFGESNGRYFIAMEYVDGLDLKRVLALSVRRRRRPPTAVSVYIVSEILKALDYAHKSTDAEGQPLRIVHRDISPSNIFISELAAVKLSDFGIAKATTRTEHSQVGEIKGKYGYVAPEMISGADVDARADIFSAAVVLAELLIVRRLFLGKTDLDTVLMLRDVRLERLYDYGQHIPSDLMQILESALTKDPNTRYQDAGSFNEALRRFLFNRHLLVQDSDLQNYIRGLDDKTPTDSTPSISVTVPQSPVHENPVRVQVADNTEYSMVRTGEPAPGPRTKPRDQADGPTTAIRPPKIGRRRKITLTPPPRAMPIPIHLQQAEEKGRLSTEHALAAVREMEAPRKTQKKMELTEEATRSLKTEAVDLDHIAASRMTATEDTSPPRQQGTLTDASLFSVIFNLAVSEETGLLVLSDGEVRKEVFLVDGDPKHVSSNVADELFGQFLVKEGVIDEQQLSLATAMLPYFKSRLGDSLVGLQLMSAIQVARYLTQQVRRKLIDAFSWETGDYQYFPGKICGQESAPLGWDGFELLGAALETLSVDKIAGFLQQATDHLRPADPPPAPPEVFRLGPLPRQLMERFDGSSTIEQLLQSADDQQREPWSRVLFLLLQTGLVCELAASD